MSMSRKHYIAAARLIREQRESGQVIGEQQWEDLFVRLFSDDNPNFREDQFRRACQPGGGELEQVSRKRALAEGWVRPWEGEE